MKPYPPLKSLVAFDAAMRLNSFSLAAEALCVTPGAVGQQIHKLEAWLGVALFVRHVRQVQPTDAARDYWQRIQPALEQIADASHALRESPRNAVWLSMPPSFAAKWFTARMARLLTRHPTLALHLNATAVQVDFQRDGIDLAIRYFDGAAADLDATRLYDDEARLYCAPAYARALDLRTPADLQRATLLVTTVQPHWARWFQQFAALSDEAVAAIPRIHFDQGLMAIDAARQGQGVVMISPLLTDAELRDGSLVEVFPLRLPLANGYYLVHPRKRALSPAAQAVKAWFIDEARAPRDPAART